MAKKITNKQHLDALISSQEELKQRNCLTETGIAYLNGLKAAQKIVYPTINNKK